MASIPLKLKCSGIRFKSKLQRSSNILTIQYIKLRLGCIYISFLHVIYLAWDHPLYVAIKSYIIL